MFYKQLTLFGSYVWNILTFFSLFWWSSMYLTELSKKPIVTLRVTALFYSVLPKAEGLRQKSKVSHLWLPLRLPKVYAAKGQRSGWRLKILKFGKFKCKFCDKNFRMIKVHVCSVFENLYYTISIRVFQKPMFEFEHPIFKYKIPNLWLHLQLHTGFDFEGQSFSTFAFDFNYGQKNHLQ